ncbi:MAG: response regulator [Flavobacteriales bacterium]|nr:response regulator [Flavobacteriales bacterium]
MDTVLPLNVLLVEDNTSYRQGLTTLISTTPGMQCTACANAEQALALLEKTAGRWW